MLLPKLMQALNDTESTRRTLVNLIVEDPSLAGSVLQRANNALYRTSREPVDSLDRAVSALGVDGLRALMAVAILQPVFRLPSGYFDSFADVTWEQAQRCAAAAETYATATASADPFIAQLLGSAQRARAHRAVPTHDGHVSRTTERAARGRKFSSAPCNCTRPISPAGSRRPGNCLTSRRPRCAKQVRPAAAGRRCDPLGRAVYFGELCGALATMLDARDAYSWDGTDALLVGQGLKRDSPIPCGTRRLAFTRGARGTGIAGNR